MTQEKLKAPLNPRDFTLLVVDDEEDMTDILACLFEKRGFRVLQANNGKQAFEIVRSERVDLVISDINMPGGNGIELLERIKERSHETPVVLFLTGFSEISVEEAFRKGAEALFAKPFDEKALTQAILNALEPGDERWKARPWRGETAIPIQLRFPGSPSYISGMILNLSKGGFFSSLDGPLPKIGERVEFEIRFTEGPIFTIRGQGAVRWIRTTQVGGQPPGCGVEFTELGEAVRNRIAELVNFLKTKQYLPNR